MQFDPDYWIPERAAYLAQLGHNVDLTDWGHLWPEQIRVRLIDLGWSPSTASDFAFASSAEDLKFAALGRAGEIAKKFGQRDSRVTAIAKNFTKEYERDKQKRQEEEWQRRLEESERRWQQWLDGYIAEIVRNAIPYYPAGTGFQRRTRR